MSVTRRPRLGLVIDSLGSGGAQRQLVELAAAIRRRGILSPCVITYHRDAFFSERLDAAGVPWSVVTRRGRFDPSFPGRLADAFRSTRLEIVHAFLLLPSFWALLATRMLTRPRPVFVSAERSSVRAARGIHALVQRMVFGGADAITVNARRELAEARARTRLGAERVRYIPNGIDLARWDDARTNPCPLPLDPRCFNLALVGGLRPEKNHELLFAALERIPSAERVNWRVWCVGGETAGRAAAATIRSRLEARGLGDTVQITGAISHVAALMSRLDGVVLTSKYEGFPNVVLEAQAAGIPVVSTSAGDAGAIVEEGVTGWLVNDDPASVAAALRRLAYLPREARKAMGALGRERVAALFSIDGVAERHENLYLELLRARETQQVGAR